MKNRYLLVLIIFAAMHFAGCKNSATEKGVDGSINFMVGKVTVNASPAVQGGTVRFGDIIETGDRSMCRVLAAGKNLLAIGPDTRVVYNIRKSDSFLILSRGRLGGLIRNRGAIGDLRIIMPTTTASIRGTIFYMAVESPEKTYTCTCNGHIHYKPETGGKEELVSASHHSARYYIREKGAITIKKGELKYHTDDSMVQAAALINEKIDWNKVE
jgi:hypothetical protein